MAEYQIKTACIGLELGNQLGTWDKLRVGILGSDVDPSIDTGRNEPLAFNEFQGALTTTFLIDALDSAKFSRQGNLAGLQLWDLSTWVMAMLERAITRFICFSAILDGIKRAERQVK